MTSRLAACSMIALLAPAAAAAQSASTSAADRLSLQAAVSIAIENNRQLQSARLEVDKADEGQIHRLAGATS